MFIEPSFSITYVLEISSNVGTSESGFKAEHPDIAEVVKSTLS